MKEGDLREDNKT